MYIYNVTVMIEPIIKNDWLEWMHHEHIPEVLDTNMFTDARLSELLEPKEEGTDSITYVVQYFTDNEENYQQYITEHAPLLRQKGFDKFGNQFIAVRSLMKVLNK